jgi:hypothetical protein
VLQVTPVRRDPPFRARVRGLVPRPLRRAAASFVADRRAAAVERELSALAREARPIVVGPWLGEVGFELLYWVPFVRAFAERYRIAPERLIVVSRGGAATWYSPFAGGAADALAFMGPDQFRERNDERSDRLGEQKQIAMTPFDEEILEQVRRQQGRDVAVLHPSLMYRLFAPYWWGHRGMEWVRSRAHYRRLETPPIDLDLPADFTAVKFYFNDCFPGTPANRAFVERTIRALEREGPVISLSTGMAMDDHAACEPDGTAMRGIQHLMTPQTNLVVQSAVVAGARRFVGTYGGFSYLAPFYGVNAVAYYSDAGGYSQRHLDVAQDVLAQTPGTGRLEVAAIPATPIVGATDPQERR